MASRYEVQYTRDRYVVIEFEDVRRISIVGVSKSETEALSMLFLFQKELLFNDEIVEVWRDNLIVKGVSLGEETYAKVLPFEAESLDLLHKPTFHSKYDMGDGSFVLEAWLGYDRELCTWEFHPFYRQNESVYVLLYNVVRATGIGIDNAIIYG